MPAGWACPSVACKRCRRRLRLEPVPPVMKELGLAEVENNPKNNRMRAI